MNDIQLKAAAEIELRKRRKTRLKNYENQIEYYRSNPWDYIVDRLGVPRERIDWALLPQYENHKWDGTSFPLMKILQGLVDNKWIGVESGTSTGKTFLGACIVLWFLECYENSIVVTTAPKREQLTLHIWRELGKLHSVFGKGDLTTLRLRMIQEKDDWLAVGFVAGVKADEESSTKAQGFHAEHMLIIFEETPGIPLPVMTAFQNTSTAPHNLILAFGNPDHQLDNLHKFCTQEGVEHIRISGFDFPNVVLNDAGFIPGAQSREGLKKLLSRYGDKESPLYLSRARGISPKQAADSLIKIEWCYKAVERFSELSEQIPGEKALGVDVANSDAGDKAAIAEGKGNVLLSVEDFHCPDANQLGKRDVLTRMKEKKIKPNMVGIDGIGVGAGTVNALNEMNKKVISLIASEAPEKQKGEEQFKNLRAQMWWQLREDLRNNNIAIPQDEELIADITTPKWTIQNGKIIVESKEKIKERLGRSPNKGDAVVYWNWVRTGRRKPAVGESVVY